MSIPDGTTTRETGSNCSWALVLVLQQNSTEKLNGHWWWCAPAADPHQKISLLDLQQYYLVVVVDSHIQRIVLATEETTVTQQVGHRPIKCQSRLWSQRGTKVDGSHHGDNPLLRPTGIQIATKSYAALQAMAPTNINGSSQGHTLKYRGPWWWRP